LFYGKKKLAMKRRIPSGMEGLVSSYDIHLCNFVEEAKE